MAGFFSILCISIPVLVVAIMSFCLLHSDVGSASEVPIRVIVNDDIILNFTSSN